MTTKTIKKTPAKKTAAKKTLPAGVKPPQDRKPAKVDKGTTDGEGTISAVLDGHPVRVDATPAANMRLMRRIKKGDPEALLEFIERAFGDDQLDQLEEWFGLEAVTDYMELFARACEAAAPN